jgi:hypothetical protein
VHDFLEESWKDSVVKEDKGCGIDQMVLTKRVDIDKWRIHNAVDFDGKGWTIDPQGYGDNERHPQRISFGFTPTYELKHYPIVVEPMANITVSNEDSDDLNRPAKFLVDEKFPANITFDEAVYAILWEISFYGGPADRDFTSKEIQGRIDEVEKWTAEGTLEEHTSSLDEVFERIKVVLG